MLKVTLMSLWRRRYGLYPLISWLLMLLVAEHVVFSDLNQEQELSLAWCVFWWVLLFVSPWWLADWFEDGAVEQLWLSPGGLSRALWHKLGVQGAVIVISFGVMWWAYLALMGMPVRQQHLGWVVYACSAPVLLMLSALLTALNGAIRQQAALLGAVVMPLALPWLLFGHTLFAWSWMGLPLVSGYLLLAGLCCLACAILPWAIHGALRIGVSR